MEEEYRTEWDDSEGPVPGLEHFGKLTWDASAVQQLRDWGGEGGFGGRRRVH